MDATNNCPVCGWTLDEDGGCASCNAGRLPGPDVRKPARSAAALCPECGTTLPGAGLACPECGARSMRPDGTSPIAKVIAVGAAAAILLMIVDLVRAVLGS